mmetsp:Transcript_16935/g.23569  ORF Transcript_16935/g.23569 Transcript_16935/m.23569 type:complete len:324 (-) Transcript_16935:47-1018(-)|eukprot:CAMPEP_0168556568 /NCGR_PEP_ID=MMETSP0413-20121227/8954_1 /TAXON_ID=136452 /ORGANISM="Filamoeba nolandi, Strain NC-AS-23-1" /LENGTH=323 /DNA_ID=CAMNT_0008587527 /DNA_START=156 /DNA_END=1127 /DNA_ORIENTATION=+
MTDARKFLANARKSVGNFLAKEDKKKDASDSDDDSNHSGSGHSSTNSNLKDSTEFKDGYYEGWLTKKGKIRRNWKKRWFTLENGLLNYYSKDYKVKEGVKAKATGSIKINGCIFGPTSLIGRKYSNSFQLITQNRTFFFFTETQPEFQMWKEKLIKNGAKWDEKITRLSLITDDDSDPDSEDSKTEAQAFDKQSGNNHSSKMNQNLFELFTTFRQRGERKELGDIRDLVSGKQATKLERLKQSPPEVVALFWTFFDYPPLNQLQITSQTQDTANSNSATLILKYQPNTTDNNNAEDSSPLIGTIQFVKEDSVWKIHHEVWEDE